jgi:hypothetical protein
MTDRVFRDSRSGYWTWPTLPNDEQLTALLPDDARAPWNDYLKLARRCDVARDAMHAAREDSDAMLEAHRLDREATDQAIARGEPGPIPAHAPKLREQAEGAKLEVEALAAHANAALDRLDRALLDAQPTMARSAFAAMNETLGDRTASALDRLDATRRLAWVANLHRDLALPHLPAYAEIERAEQIIAELPSETARRIVEQMDPHLRAALRADEPKKGAA